VIRPHGASSFRGSKHQCPLECCFGEFAGEHSSDSVVGSRHNGLACLRDSIDSFGKNKGDSINTSLAMSSGVHSVLVRAWDSAGALGDQTISVTVP